MKVDLIHCPFIYAVFVLAWPSPSNGIKHHESCRQVRKFPDHGWKLINNVHKHNLVSKRWMGLFFFLKFSSVSFSNLSRKTHLPVINKEAFFLADTNTTTEAEQ